MFLMYQTFDTDGLEDILIFADMPSCLDIFTHELFFSLFFDFTFDDEVAFCVIFKFFYSKIYSLLLLISFDLLQFGCSCFVFNFTIDSLIYL